MRALLLNRKIWIGVLVLVLLLFIILEQALKVADLAAIQNAVHRDWEIAYGYGYPTTSAEKPPYLPAFLDSAAQDFIHRRFGETYGANGAEPVHTRNREIVYGERFRAFFRGPIEDITVYDFEGFEGDLGAVLLRVRSLRRVELYAWEPSGRDWETLCTRLRALPHLEELTIGGPQFTDRALAPLAGHPRLRRLNVTDGRLTALSTRTFASLPRLTHLDVGNQYYEGNSWLTPEQRTAMTAALPKVQIVFP